MAVDNTHFKGSWRPEEDTALRQAVSKHGEKNWSSVARTFNELMGRHPLLGRAPKQCRSRYLQQLVPGIKTGEWSVEEEEVLVEGHRQFGNQWTLIASMLPGRTETAVKNHYNCTARRKVPSDAGRMTILQRYLASIGVISGAPGSRGGSSSSLKHSGGSGSLTALTSHGSGGLFSAAAAAAAAATGGSRGGGTRSSSGRRGAAAAVPAGGPSRSGSGGYCGEAEYDSGAALAHAYSEADFTHAAYAAYHHAAAAAAYQHSLDPAQLAAAMQQQQQQQQQYGAYGGAGHDDDEDDDDEAAEAAEDEEAASCAADGLLALAHAAMHLAEDDEEGQGEGGVEAAGSNGGEHDAAALADEAARSPPGSKEGSSAKASPLAPRGSGVPSWFHKGELAVSSEESDRTADEGADEGSPLAGDAAQQQRLKAGKRSSGAAAGASKRARGIVLDVRERDAPGAPPGAGAGGCSPPPLSVPATPGASSSPAMPSVGSAATAAHLAGTCGGGGGGGVADVNAALLSMIMGAFMGAAEGGGGGVPIAQRLAHLIGPALAGHQQQLQQQQQQQQPQQQQQQHGSAAEPAAAAAADC